MKYDSARKPFASLRLKVFFSILIRKLSSTIPNMTSTIICAKVNETYKSYSINNNLKKGINQIKLNGLK